MKVLRISIYFSAIILLVPSPSKANSTDTSQNGLTVSDESRLVQDLLKNYKKLNPHKTRPVLDSNSSLKIHFGMGLVQLLDFNEKEQMLNSLIWKQYHWLDQYLTWDPEDYGGVKFVRVSQKSVYTPDIILFNNAGQSKVEVHDYTMMVVSFTGEITWIPHVNYKSSCQVDMKEYPFDEQLCFFRFGSWSQSSDQVDMEHIYGNKKIDLSNYVENSEWKVQFTDATDRRLIDYRCCKEPFAEIIYTLGLKRTMSLHMRLILVPTILLTVMSCAIFWIPPVRPDRTTLGLGLFSAFFLLLISILNNSPPVPESKLGLYYIILILLVAFGLLFSVVIINLFNKDTEVPACISKFVQWVDTSCCCAKPRGRAAEQTPGPALPPNKAKWQRFALILDRTVFLITVSVVVISFIAVFPNPAFIFGQ